MKQNWHQVIARIDRLSVRERVIVFVMVSVLIVALFTLLIFDSQISKIRELSQQIRQTESSIVQARNDVRQALVNYNDPDAGNRERLKALQQELPAIRQALFNLQKGLVSPDRMTALLQDIVKSNQEVQLVSLKTLPVANLVTQELAGLSASNAQAALSAAAALVAAPASSSVYTHGVELVVQGSYAEMMEYIRQLESMPWQLLWGEVKLEVKEYPVAIMTLTVYSLSLDKKWLNL